jgi:hypothetical protein
MARPVLGDFPERVVDDALLLVSELVTNGLLHARTEIELHVRAHRNSVFIAVRDNSPRPLELKGGDPLDPGGRGLHIVAALADRWGVHNEPDGKIVWCELRSDLPAAADRAAAREATGRAGAPVGASPGRRPGARSGAAGGRLTGGELALAG